MNRMTSFPLTEGDCVEILERIRWNGKPVCPYCGNSNSTAIENNRYRCNSCNNGFSVTVGTFFHKTRIELRQWFHAISITKQDTGLRSLARQLGVNKNTASRIISQIKLARVQQKDLLEQIERSIPRKDEIMPESKEIEKKLPKMWGKGPLKIYDIEVDAYVLEDGTPVLNKGKMMKALGRPWKGTSRTDKPNFVGAKNLQPFISNELIQRLEGIDFVDGKKIISGYHADILALVCNVYLEARQAGVLTSRQLPTAQKCEILMRSFAKVGITALIYEQLGFERYKHPDALRMLIESYLAEEVRKWSKEFPDELFRQMDRIYGNEKTTSNNRPRYYAKFIRKYIYEPIEKGMVLARLDEKNPVVNKQYRKDRHHSHLSELIGLNALRAQIWQVVGVLKTSSNKRTYENNFNKLMSQLYQGELFEVSE